MFFGNISFGLLLIFYSLGLVTNTSFYTFISTGSSELLLKDFLLSKPAQGFIEDKSGFKIACVLYTSSDGVLVLSANSCMWKPNQRSTAVNNYKVS